MLRDDKQLFSTHFTSSQNKDTGMAMVLILLLVGFFTQEVLFYKLAIPVLILDMIVPKAFYPLSILWYGLSNVLGTVMSKVILTLVFILIVLPVGLMRKMMGKDPMNLKSFGKGRDSVMIERNYTFGPKDIDKPF
ncbi:MAG: SxtJ family membrane protein [Bacteroidota bacterium]